MFLKHPLPTAQLQTPLNQLPLASSQLTTSIHKVQLEMKLFLNDHLQFALDQWKANSNLVAALNSINNTHNSFTNWHQTWQTTKQNLSTHQTFTKNQLSNNDGQREEKFKTALRHANIDEIIRLLSSETNIAIKKKYLLIAPTQLPLPYKANLDKIISLLNYLLSSETLSQQEKEQILIKCYRLLLQKSLKMYLEQKTFHTSYNQKSYYSDIIQLYQKCFGKVMRILIRSLPEDNHFEKIITYMTSNTYNRFKSNVLKQFLNKDRKQNEEKIINTILCFDDVSHNHFLLVLAQQYCQETLKQLIACECLSKLNCKYLCNPANYQSYLEANKTIFVSLFKEQEWAEFLKNNESQFYITN